MINKKKQHTFWHYIFSAPKTGLRFDAGLQTTKGHFGQNTVEEKHEFLGGDVATDVEQLHRRRGRGSGA